VALPDIAERLADVNGRLGRLFGEARNYDAPLKPLDYAKGLAKESWPDRAAAAEAMKNIKGLRDWGVKEANRFLLRAAANADALGEVPVAPAAASAAGGPAQEGQPKAAEAKRFKRFRIYLNVVIPQEDNTEMAVRIDEAPEFPRAPWEPPPADAAGKTEGGQ
jgi:hypothetical protein